MKKCSFCGLPWSGYGSQPRPRENCVGCGEFLHCCTNCHHFDSKVTNSCTLRGTQFVGSRKSLNYCEEFRMTDWTRRAAEVRRERARDRWEALFR
jgi:hypothetical protein